MSNLIWAPNQIPLGATVLLVPPDSDEPAIVDGKLIPFRKLYGGVPNRAKLYALSIDQSRRGALLAQSVELEGFKAGTQFSPVQTYSPQNAPVDGKYAVFDGQERMLDERLKMIGECPLEVAKVNNGLLYASSSFPFAPHQLSGNPAFESSLPWRETPDDRLVGLIEYQLRSILALQQIGRRKEDISAAEFDLTKIVEALARRHRSSPSDFVSVFSLFGASYLRQTLLPATAQLVRIEKEDASYMQKVAVQTSA